jgi:polysaccharide biosynthesis/export protein
MQIFLNSNEYYPVPGDTFSLTIVVIGPGSQVLLSGGGTNTYTLVLKKDYSLYVPVAGTLPLKGLNYDQIKEKVIDTVNRRVTADFIDFQFLQPVSFQVLVNGLVQRSGPVNASSIMRVSDAIQTAGGFIAGATTRRIVLTRADGSERKVDMQAFLRDNQKESNPLLQPGDRILVGQSLKSVRIEGAVLTPGIFELTDSDRIPELLTFANGLTVKASKAAFRVARAADSGGYSLIEVDSAKASDFELKDGDAVQVPAMNQNSEYVTIEGPFYGKPASGAEPVSAPVSSVSVPAVSGNGASLQSLSVPTPIQVTLPHYAGMNLYVVMEKLGGPRKARADRRGRYSIPREPRRGASTRCRFGRTQRKGGASSSAPAIMSWCR